MPNLLGKDEIKLEIVIQWISLNIVQAKNCVYFSLLLFSKTEWPNKIFTSCLLIVLNNNLVSLSFSGHICFVKKAGIIW